MDLIYFRPFLKSKKIWLLNWASCVSQRVRNSKWREREMDEGAFPSFNYPFYREGTQRQSFIDYGSIGAYDIDILEDQSFTTRTKLRHHSPGQFFIGAHVAVPFQFPCTTAFPSTILTDLQVRNSKCRTDFKPTIVKQISDFYRNYPDIGLAAGRDVIKQELDCEPWNLNCLPVKTNTRLVHLTVDGKRRVLFDPINDIESFCKLFVSIPLIKYAGVSFDKACERHIPRGLPEALEDVPPQLLFDLMNESIEQIKDEVLYFDILQGNTLAYCNLPSSDNHGMNGMLFHHTGPSLETLNMKFVKFDNTNLNNFEGKWTSLLKPTLLESRTDVTVNGVIRQIDACYYEYSGVFVASRSRYNCSFFQTTAREDITEITLSKQDSFESEVEIVDMTLSPFIPGDAIIITKRGQIHVRKCGRKIDIIDVPSVAPAEKWPWYQCVYAGHPRCIITANPAEADILDLRANGSSSRTFFSIKSKEVDIHERISAVQRHPLNTHQYFIGTDQSLLIMDDRFVQHPVLKWQHHLQDPVQLIEVVPNPSPDCNDTVVMVTGSYHHEIHGYQYSNGEREVSSTLDLIGNSVVTPPVSTSLPWKVSSYDEWPSLLPISALPLSSVLKDRLTNPLTGVCCIPTPMQQGKGGFTVLQMSAPGDMFYQPFIQKSRKQYDSHLGDRGDRQTTSEGMSNPPDEEIALCKEWILNLLAMEQQNDEINNRELNLNILEADCARQFEAMISLEAPHQCCSLCTGKDGKISTSISDSEVSVCPRCGIDVKTGLELQKSKQQNTIATSRIYTFGGQSSKLYVFPNANEFQSSVSRGFLQNWFSDEPRPLELMDTAEGRTVKDDIKTSTNNETVDNQENSKSKIIKSEANNNNNNNNTILEANIQMIDSLPSLTKKNPTVKAHPTCNVSMATSQPMTSNAPMVTSQPVTSSVSMATSQPMTSNAPMVTSQPVTSTVSMATSQPMTNNAPMVTPQPVTSSVSMATSQPMVKTLSSVKKNKKRKLDLSMGF